MSEPIRLERADFFELQALILKAELAKVAAQGKLAALVSAQGGDPARLWALDEGTLSLVARD